MKYVKKYQFDEQIFWDPKSIKASEVMSQQLFYHRLFLAWNSALKQ